MNEESNYDRSYHPVNLGEFYRNGQEIVSRQKTLEEVAENYSKNKLSSLAFIAGAMWQQKQNKKLYSKEEVLEHLNHLVRMPSSKLDLYTDDIGTVTIKWFEQFKNR